MYMQRHGECLSGITGYVEMTQCELAAQLDYASEWQQRIESGEISCSVDKLVEMAPGIGCFDGLSVIGYREKTGKQVSEVL